MSTQLTTHKHPNGSEWIHSHAGVDGHGEQHWQWCCVNADKSVDYYPCSQHGWIDAKKHLPNVIGTRAIVFDGLWKCPEMDEWVYHGERYCWVDIHDENVSHWMPQSENPG